MMEEENENISSVTPRNSRKKITYQNDIDGMLQKLSEIKLKSDDGRNLPWEYSLDVVTDEPVHVQKVEDDLTREATIYQKTLENVKKALSKLEELSIPYKRPDDYFAEMVKTDEHMLKIKDHLLAEKRRKEEKEKAIKERQMKKFSKQFQIETQKRREKEKSDDINVVKLWRKRKKDSNIDEEFPEELLDPNSELRASILNNKKVNSAPVKSKKRKMKDLKYGFGGKKRFKKENTSESSHDMTGFSVANNKKLPPGFKKKRPGKNARKQRRST